jgi:DNA polymerase (family 10)
VKTSKRPTNLQVSDLLRSVATSYKIINEKKNFFKITAYERAADSIEHLSSEICDLFDEDKLETIPSVGESIATHLKELFQKGESKHFNSVLKGIPPAVFKLIEIPGIGAKTAYKLATTFKIPPKNPVLFLENLAQQGKIENLEGMGEASQKEILSSIKQFKLKPEKRMLLPKAQTISSEILSWLTKHKDVQKAHALGSLRRSASTIGDIDLSAATQKPSEVLKHFTNYPKSTRTLEIGETSASIILPGSIQVDLRVVSPEIYGSLLQHFTGSKHHNIALREYAQKKDLSLSEYGIKTKKGTIKTKTEEQFYKKLGLSWIPPELREGRGEIEAAKNNTLPDPIEISDIKGDLHIHSNFNVETSHDYGEHTMEQMVKKANQLKYEYIAFSEHNPSQKGHTQSQTMQILKKKREKIDKLNYSISKDPKKGIKKVFNSLEIDILPSGKLAIDDKSIQTLDFAIVSIHSSFTLSKEKQTKRILNALLHPKVKILGHPTARKLNKREAVELNWPEIFDFCVKSKKILEINSTPDRLDLPDFIVFEAIKSKVCLVINTDSHHNDHLNFMPLGVSVARRGWAQKNDIINTKSLNEITKILTN